MLVELLVGRCVSILDEKKPDWPLRVDPMTFSMESKDNSIPAQVFGDHERGMEELGINARDAPTYGLAPLTVPFVTRNEWAKSQLRKLEAEWLRVRFLKLNKMEPEE